MNCAEAVALSSGANIFLRQAGDHAEMRAPVLVAAILASSLLAFSVMVTLGAFGLSAGLSVGLMFVVLLASQCAIWAQVWREQRAIELPIRRRLPAWYHGFFLLLFVGLPAIQIAIGEFRWYHALMVVSGVFYFISFYLQSAKKTSAEQEPVE